ncbi:TIGR04222 domain-containing membrane protein [Streptomyces sp. NPDC087300]|uniref:TIGR04222 domain-containing membrane protein n=1 Tax=Streptomyces sp. NPDC087300 TaxID=3365780 RepID=UPI0038153D61
MYVVGTIYTLAVVLSAGELIRGTAAARRTRTSPFRADDGSADGVFVRGTLEAAFLSGGPARVADALIAGLHEDGGLVVAGPGIVGLTRPTPRNAAEQAVADAYAAAPNGALHWLRAELMRGALVQGTGDALARRGLIVRRGPQLKWRRWAGLHLVLSLFGFFAAAMLTVAQYSDAPSATSESPAVDGVFMLLPAVIFGVVSGLICLRVTEQRLTIAGRGALREYVLSSRHLTGAAHLVATRGLSAAHPDLRAQLVAAARVRRAPTPSTGPHLAPHPTPYSGSTSSSPSSGTPTWCGSGSGYGGGGGSACSGGGSSCSGGGSACSGGGSSCSGGGGGSSCSGGGSSCSGGGSSCSGGGGSSCSSS